MFSLAQQVPGIAHTNSGYNLDFFALLFMNNIYYLFTTR